MSDNRYVHLLPGRPVILGGAREAAEAFAGHAIAAEARVSLPGRLEELAGETRDGAHNLDGARWLVEQLPAADHTLCVSILGDKDVDEMLRVLSRVGRRLVATQSSNARALPADEVASRARPFFEHVETVDDPLAAVARAHELGEPVLVTGSLYLLADLEARSGVGSTGPPGRRRLDGAGQGAQAPASPAPDSGGGAGSAGAGTGSTAA